MPTITFVRHGHMFRDTCVEAEPGETLLQVAQRGHVPLGYACGGNGACSTCHLHVREGLETLSPIEESEERALDMAFDLKPESRLGCQARVGNANVTVEITEESYRAYLSEHAEER